jgi:flagellar basal-body rod modification protein FlgD
MAVNGVGGTTDATGTVTSSATGGTSNVDFNTFLKLLVAQLKNQDPLNPLDGTQFTGQIAQFSTLEQQINTNTKLSALLEQRDFGQQTLATSYLGKVVLAPGDTVASTGGTTEFGYSLDGTASKVDVSIYDKDGKLVRSVAGDGTDGNHIVTWDGKDDAGNALAAGNYTVKVSAKDTDGKTVASETMVYGKVASVLNDNGTSSLIMSDGRQIELSDVLAVTSLTTS